MLSFLEHHYNMRRRHDLLSDEQKAKPFARLDWTIKIVSVSVQDDG